MLFVAKKSTCIVRKMYWLWLAHPNKVTCIAVVYNYNRRILPFGFLLEKLSPDRTNNFINRKTTGGIVLAPLILGGGRGNIA